MYLLIKGINMQNIKIATTKSEINKAFAIRRKVFIEEQNVPEQRERDEYDKEAKHVIVIADGKVIGTTRLRFIEEGNMKIERMAVIKEFRSQGFGEQILKFIENYAKTHNVKELILHSQWQARKFYAKFGFKERGKIFMDAGIEHIEMFKRIGF